MFVRVALPALVACSSIAPGPVSAQYLESGAVRLLTTPGAAAGDLFGWRVRALGDVNQDGRPDFAVATPFQNLNVGRVSVHSGLDGARLWFRDETRTSSILGFDLTTIDDLDADGAREVIASAPFGDNGGGFVHVYSGRSGTILKTFAGAALDDAYGYAIAAGGDYDGDGTRDIAIGAVDDDSVRAGGGRVYVYSSAGFRPVATLDPLPGDSEFGTSLAFVGDVDGDGRDELAVGARTSFAMHVIGWNGSASVVRWSVTGLAFGSGIDGNKFAGGGDVDGDGRPDVIADESNPNQRARLFSGANGTLLQTFAGSGDSLGRGAKIVRDQNGDGRADVLVGAPGDSSQGSRNGRVMLYSGRDFRLLRKITNLNADANFGNDADLIDDRNGDGVPELLVAASGVSALVRSFGRVDVVAGEPFLAGWRNYGAGLAGTLWVPALRAGSDPVLAASFVLQLGNSAGVATHGVLVGGVTAASLATPWGGTLLVLPQLALGLALPAGGASVPLAVPNDPTLRGGAVLLQSILLDPGTPAGVAESAGLRLGLGV